MAFKDITVLLVEDVKETNEKWTAFFREICSEDSQGVRSYRSAMDLFEQGLFFDVVFIDLEILEDDDSNTPNNAFGKLLLEELKYMTNCVMASGSLDGVVRRELKDAMGFIDKPYTDQDFVQMLQKLFPR